jgi:aspartate dehydrogenase
MTRTVSVIGAGRIGRQVIAFVRESPGLALGRILTRSGVPDTGDAATFFATPADIIIDTAGPGALTQFGPAAMAHADLWTVGAVALVSDDLRSRMLELGEQNSTVLRLFSPWISGIGSTAPLSGARLHIRAERPGIAKEWSGPLSEAVTLFPDDLNSAVAAALCGPGLDATTVELADSGKKGTHRIAATLMIAAGCYKSSAEFSQQETGTHPTAEAITGALRIEGQRIRYG